MVERRREEARGAGRGAQDDEVRGRLGRDEQLVAARLETGDPLLAVGRGADGAVTALARHGIHEALADAHPLGADVDEVSRERRLGDLDAVAGEVVEQLGLGADRGGREDLDDPLLRGRARWRRSSAPPSVLLDEPGQERLLRVEAVLGLLPDQRCRAVDDLGVDLEPAVGGRQWRKTASGAGLRHERLGDPERLERAGGALARVASALRPIETQVSVATTSAPVTASRGSSVTSTDRPARRRSPRPGDDVGPGWWEAGGADPHVHAGERAAER